MDAPPGLMSTCQGCSPQKPVSVYAPGKVQLAHASRKFGRALAVHLEAAQSLIISEHEACLRALQHENCNLRNKLQAVDSAVHGPESPTFGGRSQAEPKDGGPKAYTSDDGGGLASRLSSQPTDYQGMPVAVSNDARVEYEELLQKKLNKALEELRHDFVGIRQELHDVASSVCTEVRLAASELPTRVAAPEVSNNNGEDYQEEPAANNSSQEAPVAAPKVVKSIPSRKSLRGSPDSERWNALQKIVFSNTFEMVSGLVILLNTLVMALQLQYDGFDAGSDLRVNNYRSAESTWPGAELMFYICDLAFNIVFSIELLMRFAAMGLKIAVCNRWMWFDTAIVSLGLADFIANEVTEGGLGMDPTMIRLARLIRLVRMAKVFKSMSAFDSLFLLIKSIQASMNALIWSFLLLVTVQITTGMFMCQMLNSYVTDETEDDQKRITIFKYFGTFTRTMLTMFEITLANWVPSCRALIEHVSEFYMLFYVVYRCMFCFAVLKVIAAVFITETNRVLQNDDELTVLKTRRDKAGYLRKLQNLFDQMDMGKDGELDLEDLQYLMTDDYMVTFLATLGFEGHDFEKIFTDAAKGPGGKINLSSFLDRVVKAKGFAKTIDIFRIVQLLTEIDARVANLARQFNQVKDQNLQCLALPQARGQQ